MEAALAFEAPAVEVRERLAEFVSGVAERLPLRRQRENALLYVRGLIEQGGRKSLQPTLFRLEETPARYESLQQFLADSPWDPALLVRACAERGGARDRRRCLGGRRHRDRQGRQALAGGEAPVLGHAGQDRQLPDHGLGARGRRAGHAAAWLGAVPARGVVRDRERRRKAKIPEAVGFRRSRSSPSRSASRRPRGRSRGADPRRLRLRRRHAFRTGWAELELEYVLAVAAETSVYGPETTFAVPPRKGTVGRPRTVAHPDRKPESVRSLAERLPARPGRRSLPHDGRRGGQSRFAFVRVVATHPVRTDYLPPRRSG